MEIEAANQPGLNEALYRAVTENNREECERLIAAGASVDKVNDICGPLHEAAALQHDDICELLLAHGANVNEINTVRCRMRS